MAVTVFHQIQDVEEIIKFRFIDHSLLHKALQGSGFPNTEGKEKLALIGSSVLRLLLATEGHGKNEPSDQLNNSVSAKISNAYLAKLGFLQHLDSFIHGRVHERKSVSDTLMATTMEAILGAVFLDSGKDFYQMRKVAVALNLLRTGPRTVL